MVNTVYGPGRETTDETFVWYRVDPRLHLGLAHMLKQNAVRYLASYNLSPETMGGGLAERERWRARDRDRKPGVLRDG